jgi:3-oxosteroid 1-dehydrogenase
MTQPAKTFDFIIVGSGGGSMCAALVVRAQGRSVLLLEKTDLVGGTTARSGGVLWIPNNPLMKKDGVPDSVEQAMTYLDSVVEEQEVTAGTSREKRLAYVVEGGRMIDFLVKQGIKLHRFPYWPDYYSNYPGGTDTGRAIIADLFDANELGEHKAKLRPNYVPMPGKLEELMNVPLSGVSLKGKLSMMKVGMRMMTQKITGKDHVTNGAALQGQMFKAAIDAGVDIRTNAAVSRLVTDAEGAVTGVVATIDGVEQSFGARSGVLVNAGGFARNQAMRDKYQPGKRAEWSNTIEGDTGEMIEEMMRIGAATAQMDEFAGNQMAVPPDPPEILPMVMGELAKPHSIVVDQKGLRYLREVQSYMSFCKEVYERDKVSPAVPSWHVLDSRFIDKYMLIGTLAKSKKPQQWFDSGFVVKADTIEELAIKCGMDPTTLKTTIERFNGFARAGKDEDFHRGASAYDRYFGDPKNSPSPNLGTLEKAPFYAYKVYPGDIGTWGGAVTDIHARVLREDGSPIPGLYATGVSTASVMGRTYPGPGASVGPSFVFGFIAAKHAMGADNIVGAQLEGTD